MRMEITMLPPTAGKRIITFIIVISNSLDDAYKGRYIAVSFNPDHSVMLPKEIILHRKNRAPEVKRITYDLMGLGKNPDQVIDRGYLLAEW
jgi:hypothetical protein